MGKFIAYRHTGADPERLDTVLPLVRDSLEAVGEQTYCTYFDETKFKSSGMGPRAIMEHAFAKIEELGGLFVLLDGPEKSEGQILEVGFCIAKVLPIVVAKRKEVENTYLPSMAGYHFTYESDEALREEILNLPAGF